MEHAVEGEEAKNYWPLILLVIVAAIGGVALNTRFQTGFNGWMHGFMGLFLFVFATLKLFDVPAFAEAFTLYDPLASKIPVYAKIFPVIEFILSLGFLSQIWIIPTYILTIIVYAINIIGVFKVIRDKTKMYCPCMGTILKVPLSIVTLVEDVLMVLMSLFLLYRTW